MHVEKSTEQLRTRLETAKKLAALAGEKAMSYFRSDTLSVDTKENGTPVSIADRAAERLIREGLAETYPDEGIIGEEEGMSADLQRVWIIDPIDGTESFIRGAPLFGTLIAYEEEGEVELGVANLPAINETIFAAKGMGAWWIGPGMARPIEAKVSETKSLSEAMLSYTSYSYFEKAEKTDALIRMLAATRDSRGWSDCYGHVLAATGRIDIALDPVMEIWDCAPFRRILEEAGGLYSTFSGSKSIRDGSSISSNPHLMEAVLKIINE